MNGHDAKSGSVASVTPGSPATKRKPVPTPRSTLRKPTPADEQARKKLIINNGIDSQVGLCTVFFRLFGSKNTFLTLFETVYYVVIIFGWTALLFVLVNFSDIKQI